MMTFRETLFGWVANNSIKPVCISFIGTTQWDLALPKGDLYSDERQSFDFASFEEAKRYAETNVGMKMNWEDF